MILGHFNKRTIFVFSVAVSILVLQSAFQNCSPRTSAFSATGEVGQDANYIAPVLRNISVSPITDQIENDQPIKVVLIVDDSQTMLNSQNNLARSMSKLATVLSNYDAEILVLTTSTEKFISTTNHPAVLTATTRTNVTERKLKTDLPVYQFLKSQTAAQKEAAVTALSNAIKAVGTAGNQLEKPLFSMAVALGSESFLKANDNVLVYVITDEDDTQSKNIQLNSYLKLETKVTQLSYVLDKPYYYVDGYRYNRRYYRGTWNEPGNDPGGQEICGYDDLGNPIYCSGGGGGGGSGSAEFNTYNECWAEISGRLAASCQQTDSPDSGTLNGRSVTEACDQIKLTHPNQITLCVSTQIRLGGPETVPEKVLSSEKNYYAEFDTSSKTLQEKLIDLLNSKFGGSYLIATQVNIQGQNCATSAGQSFDVALKAFEQLAPKGRFIRSSICEEAAVSGDVLREIAIQLTLNITNQYSVVLDESERILTMAAVKNSERISLAEGKDFTFANNIVRLTSLNATDFDYLDVGIGKKLNWKE